MNRELVDANDPIFTLTGAALSKARWDAIVSFLDGLVSGLVAGATIGLVVGYALRGHLGA